MDADAKETEVRETLIEVMNFMKDLEHKFEMAEQELKWLKKTAETDEDFARVVGYEDCLKLLDLRDKM